MDSAVIASSHRCGEAGVKQVANPVIATLTFHEAINYGAALQCYALQKTIQSFGYQTEVLNYSCRTIRDKYRRSPSRTIKSSLAWQLRRRSREGRLTAFGEFFRENVSQSDLVRRDDLSSFCERYSKVIVGSDQVWNTDLTNGDRTYFLDFLPPKKRVSYAASIGLRAWKPSLEHELTGLLDGFSALTVREDVAADYLEGLLGERPAVVCDPVFLLSQENWDAVITEPDIGSDYVLLYSFGKPSRDGFAWANCQARFLGCRLVALHYGALPVVGALNVRDAGPKEFLGWVRRARLVISPSFHVCSLSALFERDFCWFRSECDDQGLKSRSSRIEDLLCRLGIEGRSVRKDSDLPELIDYGPVKERLIQWRNESLDILKKVISD